MITIVLQCAVAVLSLATGLVALAVARQARPGCGRSGWLLAGGTFALLGVSGIPQTTWAAWAFRAGPGTAVYDAYLAWSPAANHGRSILLIVSAALLIVHVLGAGAFWQPLRPRWAGAALVCALVVGTLMGTLEGRFRADQHYANSALLQLGTLVLFLTALLGAAVRSTLDRVLWMVLTVYAFHLAVSILWMTGLAWSFVPRVWSPRPSQMHAIYMTVWLGMLGLSVWRLQLARRGEEVPGLTEPLPAERHAVRAFGP